MSEALFAAENHSVPVKKLPTRRDGAIGTISGCRGRGAIGSGSTFTVALSAARQAFHRASAQL
jgi:hypothetical protein